MQLMTELCEFMGDVRLRFASGVTPAATAALSQCVAVQFAGKAVAICR